jgi:hypothetical protein
MGPSGPSDEILAWMREHAAEHTIRGMVLTGELAEHWLRAHEGTDVAEVHLLALADVVQGEVDAARQAREREEG